MARLPTELLVVWRQRNWLGRSIRAALLFLLAGLSIATPRWALAVCLDPVTYLSGYHRPLEDEINAAELIAIGSVTGDQALQDDPSDSYGVSAHLYTVRITQQLKGRVPRTIGIRVENDSSRYWMAIGERHLLFLGKQGEYFSVDSCGNSSALPLGDKTVKQVKAKLVRASDAR